MTKLFIGGSLLFLASSCGLQQGTNNADSFTQYVDPYIGTGGHGHVFVGANVPYGAVQLGPSNISTGWDWVSGYHISDSTIMGFAHQHLSGTGIGDLGDVVFLPFTGDVRYDRGVHGDEKNRSLFLVSEGNRACKARLLCGSSGSFRCGCRVDQYSACRFS